MAICLKDDVAALKQKLNKKENKEQAARDIFAFASTLDTGVHAVLLYEDSDDGREAEVGFIKSGLQKGEHCFYLSVRDEPEKVAWQMEEFGINTSRYLREGLLHLLKVESPSEDPEGPEAGLDKLCKRLFSIGSLPLRVVGRLYEPSTPPRIKRNIILEGLAQSHFNELRWSAICSYDVSKTTPEMHDSWFLAMVKNHDALITAPRSHKGIGFFLR